MAHTISEIAAALGAEAAGDVSLTVTGASEPATATADQLALALSPAYADRLPDGAARAAVLWPGADWQALGLKAAIFAPRGRLAMAQLTQMLDDDPAEAGIHPTAIISEGATLGQGVSVGPFSIVGAGAQIGAGSRIGAHVTIAGAAALGANARLHDGVRLCRNVTIGTNVILHPNVVIGADGFSFVTAEPSNVERVKETLGAAPLTAPDDPTHHRIHSLGGVVIGDDVEIGANSTVDAGTIRPTRVGHGTKIDNLVQVGHNVVLGDHCLLAAQSAVAGSSVIGDRTVLGGKSGVADNVTVGTDCVITGASIVLSNVPDGRVMMGFPAVKMQSHLDSYKALRRLPRILRDLAKRQNSVSNPGQSD
ncbi:UDP-3-O-(3-hydroxymyristoyl)glucosamine N-acyltransferase [Loktanella sp. IMCC34160]|uniref:UDP-3-O-(3-hydroxymyristoyl)glucosamine N-acyltransferase n=1 Tax=Loktanella sp. IMCC34160 TaxID=2510646 RepID=UPI00101C4415|nr:UDP-3-O-(3-hydroxymyristoyl)glucosamine N-acyltransferase [Loktanella sp. IMCC34160]RYG92330.1 UDP-3-O-(3-hydroxymyristoyl)glucosamine N-acyltransferase [Loktanella sp. IMCC34160]